MSTDAIVTMAHIHCAACGVLFGVTEDYQRRRREDHESFYCPSGHSNYYAAESETERAKRQADEARRRAAAAEGQAKRERQRASGYKGQITKIKNRVRHGVCPCCNRTFQNLARHMAGQHPEWEPDGEAVAGMRLHHRGGPWYDVIREDGDERVAGPIRGRSRAFRKLMAFAGGDDGRE